jgi:hypothetical protein
VIGTQNVRWRHGQVRRLAKEEHLTPQGEAAAILFDGLDHGFVKWTSQRGVHEDVREALQSPVGGFRQARAQGLARPR